MTNKLNETDIKNIVTVIPALNPDERLVLHIDKLRECGFEHIVVIDDGSREECGDIFDSLHGIAVVLHHEKNKGKGAALKTGFKWIKENASDVIGVITLDSDGQHTVSDCVKLADKLCDKDMLLLGTRDFDLPGIPLKSRSGNKITSLIFKILYGEYLVDTQTGLRAFPIHLIDFMSAIEGERYEYEMNVLIACAKAGIPMVSVPIETVYENNNEGSHFRPFADSFRIYRLIFGNFFKFTGSSTISMLVDQGLFNFLNLAVFSNGSSKSGRFILLSTAIARVFSASLNFTLNRTLVFKNKDRISKTLFRYALTCFCIMTLSAAGTWATSRLGINTTIAKLIVDGALYLLSYKVQEKWVFCTME